MRLEEQERLRVDIEKADLDAYRKLETWGSSLFLGALGLLGKQLVDWELNPETTKHLALPVGLVLLPSAVGLAAFIFLRVVNFRSHRAGWNLRQLAEPPRHPGLHVSWGALGLILAIMPLLLGYAISWWFAIGRPERQSSLCWLTVTGAVALAVAIVVHVMTRRSLNSGDTISNS